VRQLALTRGLAIFAALILGSVGLGVGFARLALSLATGSPVGPRIPTLLAAFAGLLAAARLLSPDPRPALVHLLLAPLPLSALILVASITRAVFLSGSVPPRTHFAVATALVIVAALTAWRLQARGFYSRKWFGR